MVEISFDLANTDLHYLTSHPDAAVPSGASQTSDVIEQKGGITSTSQKLNPIEANSTIGSVNVRVLDKGGAITSLISSKLASGSGLRGKRLRIYTGFAGDSWSEYELVQTQIIDSFVFDKGTYRIRCSDIHRSARKEIFDLAQTNLLATLPEPATTKLSASIGGGDTTIGVDDTALFPSSGTIKIESEEISYTGKTATSFTGCTRGVNGTNQVSHSAGTLVIETRMTVTVKDTSQFEMLAHGSSYSHLPNATVGYIKIEDEIISYTGKTATTFTGCLRGVLNSKAVRHEVDLTADDDRKTEVKEFVYLEMPAPKLALAILTGDLYNQAGKTLPTKWHLNIDAQYIRTSDFTNIGSDWWDPNDDTQGVILRFSGEKKQDAKRFIEQQINLVLGAFSPIYSDGQIGLKRMTTVLSDAGYVRQLDETNVVSYGPLTHDMKAVRNQIQIDWNWDDVTERFTRSNLLVDNASISKHGPAELLRLKLRGLYGGIHSQNTLAARFDSLRSRHSGPPLKINVQVLPSNNDIEVGDIVRLKLANARDYTGSLFTVDRSFEVQGITHDWLTGRVTFDLFGSAEPAGAIAPTGATSPLADSFYTSQGTNLQTYLENNYPGVFSVVGGVGRIQGNCTINGGTDLNASAAIYYYNGPLQVDDGVVVTILSNVQLRVKGHFEIDGEIEGRGRGHPGVSTQETPGMPGFTGTTKAGGGIIFRWQSTEAQVAVGQHQSFPTLTIVNNGSSLLGIPADLRGTSGGSGYDYRDLNNTIVYASGGRGGNSGGGLVVVCRGATFGTNGKIDLSGDDGSLGLYDGANQVYAGSGAGGAPGACLFLLDGDTVNIPSNNLTAKHGLTPTQGTPIPPPQNIPNVTLGPIWEPVKPATSYYQGIGGQDRKVSNFAYQFIPANIAPQANVPLLTSVPVKINVTVTQNNPQTPAQNLTTIEVGVTPPSDGNYSYSNIYYRLAGQTAWVLAGPTSPEAVIVVPMDGSTYEIIARPVSIFDVESQAFIQTKVTVATASGGVVLSGGNYINTSPTVGQPSNGQGISLTNTALTAYDASGNAKVIIDAQTGLITAVDGNFSGTITANAGSIGGWSVTANSITKGNVTLDAANTRIQAGPDASTYVRMDASGITGVDAILGTTFKLPTDGSPPTFSGGVINSTKFVVTTAGIITTSDTVGDGSANSQGILINDTGLKAFGPNSSSPGVYVNAADGTITIGDWKTDISGTGVPASYAAPGIDSNVFPDPNFTEQAVNGGTYWNTAGTVVFDATGGENNTPGVSLKSNGAAYISKLIPVSYGDVLYVKGRFRLSDDLLPGTAYTMVYAIMYDKNGAVVANDGTNDQYDYGVTVSSPLGSWQDYNTTLNIDNKNASFVEIRGYLGGGVTAGSANWDNIYASRAQFGSTNQADLDQIRDATTGLQLTSGNIRAGQTAFDTGIGFYLGFSGANVVLSLGDSAGNKLTWSEATNKLTLTGDIEASSFITATSGKRIDINKTNPGELLFYGDRGDGTIEQLATIGIKQSGSDWVIASFGTYNSGNSRVAVQATSFSGDAILGITSTGYGCILQTGFTGKAPLRLVPNAYSTPPTHQADKGSLWVTSSGVLYINTNGSTAWQKVGAQ